MKPDMPPIELERGELDDVEMATLTAGVAFRSSAACAVTVVIDSYIVRVEAPTPEAVMDLLRRYEAHPENPGK